METKDEITLLASPNPDSTEGAGKVAAKAILQVKSTERDEKWVELTICQTVVQNKANLGYFNAGNSGWIKIEDLTAAKAEKMVTKPSNLQYCPISP